MRLRAGIVLVENGSVALIERHRNGEDYFVFPGGGVDEGESPERGAIRETLEELGLEVTILQKIAIIHFQESLQVYYLVKREGGTFGAGTGEEFTESDPDHPQQGIYIPIWMPLDELSSHPNVYPADVARLLLKAHSEGWPIEPIEFWEHNRTQ